MIEASAGRASYVEGVKGPTFAVVALFSVQIPAGPRGSLSLCALCASVVKMFPGPGRNA
jgi:hypothetical protein